jgi:asparagine synthase (glutamine-hydrolysing)
MLPLPRSTTEETITSIRGNIAEKLMDSVIKRIVTTDRPVACLLSGGLDSSLVTALVNNYYKSIHNVKINT